MKAHSKLKILLIEPVGGFIRLDRCMQSINSWGGVYRFPLNLARIGGHLLGLGHEVRFMDLQADPYVLLHQKKLTEFEPDICILSSGFPSMFHDSATAKRIKHFVPSAHISTFGVAPTLLKETFFEEERWGFEIPFDSIITGGEPALGYEQLIQNELPLGQQLLIHSVMEKTKSIQTVRGRILFNHDLYRSPFTGDVQTYIEGSYGCPENCTFCVVPKLFGGSFSKRSPKDIVDEFKFVIENNGVQQVSLWDEGTTFQRKQVKEICEGLIELRKSSIPAFKNFTWNTRSTTALLDEETVSLMKQSSVTGLTLGIESFDEKILASTNKGTTLENNHEAIKLLKDAGIYSIGHIVLGLPEETRESAERTIQGAVNSGLDIAQFYCAVPYPDTPLYNYAKEKNLIRVTDLTMYELCNPIMDTEGGLSYLEIGNLRKEAMKRFYENRNSPIQMLHSSNFKQWSER